MLGWRFNRSNTSILRSTQFRQIVRGCLHGKRRNRSARILQQTQSGRDHSRRLRASALTRESNSEFVGRQLDLTDLNSSQSACSALSRSYVSRHQELQRGRPAVEAHRDLDVLSGDAEMATARRSELLGAAQRRESGEVYVLVFGLTAAHSSENHVRPTGSIADAAGTLEATPRNQRFILRETQQMERRRRARRATAAML